MGQRLGMLIFLVVGIGLLVGAWFPTKSTLDLRRDGERVPATIVSINVASDSDGTTYSPIYEYVVDGERIRHTESVTSSSRPNIGEEATLLVDPDDPRHVKAQTFMGQWFFTALLGGLGALFSIIGLAGVLFTRSARGAEPRPAGELPPLGAPDARPPTSPVAPATNPATTANPAPPTLTPPPDERGPFL